MHRHSYVRNRRSFIWEHTYSHRNKQEHHTKHLHQNHMTFVVVCVYPYKVAWRLCQQEEDS